MSHILLSKKREKGIVKSILIKILQILAYSSFPPQLTILLQRLRGVKIGKMSVIGRFVYIDDYKPELLKIGKNVVLSACCIVLTHKRTIENYSLDKAYYDYPHFFGEVIIEDNAQIGVGSIIMPNVRIGKGAIIGAGSVVINDIPPGCLAVGVPAKVVKNYLEEK